MLYNSLLVSTIKVIICPKLWWRNPVVLSAFVRSQVSSRPYWHLYRFKNTFSSLRNHNWLFASLIQTFIARFLVLLASKKYIFIFLPVLITLNGFIILMFFVFAVFLKLVLLISFLKSQPLYFLRKKHLKTFRLKEFLRLLFIKDIFIYAHFHRFKTSSLFY